MTPNRSNIKVTHILNICIIITTNYKARSQAAWSTLIQKTRTQAASYLHEEVYSIPKYIWEVRCKRTMYKDTYPQKDLHDITILLPVRHNPLSYAIPIPDNITHTHQHYTSAQLISLMIIRRTHLRVILIVELLITRNINQLMCSRE